MFITDPDEIRRLIKLSCEDSRIREIRFIEMKIEAGWHVEACDRKRVAEYRASLPAAPVQQEDDHA